MGKLRRIPKPTNVLDTQDIWHKVEDTAERVWDTDLAKGVLAMFAACGQWSPGDLKVYFFGAHPYKDPQETEGLFKVWVPAYFHITSAYFNWFADTARGTDEEIKMYIKVNGTTSTLIATVANADASKLFSNTALSIYMIPGDYFEMRLVTPNWSTNPTGVSIGGNVYGVAS
jgi:hypothetical protein